MNKKFNEIFTNYEQFKQLILDPINLKEKNPIWLNDSNFKYNNEMIYDDLALYLGESKHNFNNDDLFIRSFQNTFIGAMSEFYFRTKQLEAINFENLKSDWFNNIQTIKRDSKSSSSGKNENRYSTTPVDAQIKTILDDLPLNNSDRSLIENAINSNELATTQVLNGYELYKTAVNSTFKTHLSKFITTLSMLFTGIESNNETYDHADNDNVAQFRSGEYVYKVDYLGLINQEAIKKLDAETTILFDNDMNLGQRVTKLEESGSSGMSPEQVQQLNKATSDIEYLGDNYNKLDFRVNQNNNQIHDLSDNKLDKTIFENEKQAQEHKNQTQDNEIKAIIDGLKDLKPFKYVGEYVPGTTYKTNDLVSVGNVLWLSKVDNNTTEPVEGDNWLKVSSEVKVDLTDYYTKEEINNQNKNQDDLITENKNQIANNKTSIENLNTSKQDTLISSKNIEITNNVIDLNKKKIQFFDDNGPIFEKVGDVYSSNMKMDLPIFTDVYTQYDGEPYLSFTPANEVKIHKPLIYSKDVTLTDETLITKKYVDDLMINKQDKLIAGENITISGNTISATGGSEINVNYSLTKTGNTLAVREEWLSQKTNDFIKNKLMLIEVLPANTRVGVNDWNVFKNVWYAGVVDSNGNRLDLDNTSNVSNNLGSYNGYSRSYQNYKTFYRKVIVK